MDMERIGVLVQRADKRRKEIVRKYEGTSPETAKAIGDILDVAIQFRVGECTNDTDKKNAASKIIFDKMDDMIGKGMAEDVLVGYIRQITGIIAI